MCKKCIKLGKWNSTKMFKGDPADILTASNFAAHSLSYFSQYYLHSPALDKAIAVMLASLFPSTNIRDVGAGGPGGGGALAQLKSLVSPLNWENAPLSLNIHHK